MSQKPESNSLQVLMLYEVSRTNIMNDAIQPGVSKVNDDIKSKW